MDIRPTILELAAVDPPQPIAAKSLLPILEDRDSFRTAVFAEQARDGIFTTSDFMTMVRTNDWKLVHFLEALLGVRVVRDGFRLGPPPQ